MKKILSVCIPTYNMEALLARCLDSFILEKEYMDLLEIIIVNDGSKDNSSKIAHRYVDMYPETFIVIDKLNGNYGSCINAALKVATGKYFRICDSDDHYNNNVLKDYVICLQNTDTDIVFSPFTTRYAGSDHEKTLFVNDPLLNCTFNFIDFEGSSISDFFAMHCIAIKTNNLIDNNYYQTEGISYTDTQYTFYSLLYSRTFSFFKNSVYIYYVGRTGQTVSKEAQIRTYMHFFKNAERMIVDYIKLSSSTPLFVASNIMRQIATVSLCYTNVVLGYKKSTEEDINRIKTLLEYSKTSIIKCDLYSHLMRSRNFRLWYKYHIPQSIIYYLNKIR